MPALYDPIAWPSIVLPSALEENLLAGIAARQETLGAHGMVFAEAFLVALTLAGLTLTEVTTP